MKRHLQCAEHAQSATNLTKYCACHEICKFKTSAETPWIASANRKTIRRQSDDNPTTIRSENRISHPPLRRPYSSDLEHDFVLKNTTFRAPAISQNVTKCCACHEKSHSNFTKYCACHAKCISWLIRVSYETSFPMRRASKVNLQPQQILPLPRKMNLMIDPRHILKRHLQCAEQAQSASNLTKYCACHEICKFKTSAETPWIASANRKTIRRQSDDNPTIIRSENRISHPPLRRPYSSDLEHDFVLKNTTFRAPAISQNVTKCCACHEKSHSNFTKYCAWHEKCISWLIRVSYETSFPMRRASKVNLQPQQILPLPRKMNLMIDPRHILKRHLQCAEQAQSASNLTKYCACHEICKFKTSAETPWIASANRKTIRRQSDDNPTIIRSENRISHPPLRRPYSSDLEHDFVLKNTTFRAPAISQNVTKCCACHEKSHSNFTKYCAWHEKCILLFSTLFSLLSWHLFSLGIYSL